MTAPEAYEWLSAKPFRPFQVVHRDGRVYDVASRSDAQVYNQHLLVLVDHDPETEIAETFKLIGWQQILSIRPAETRLAA